MDGKIIIICYYYEYYYYLLLLFVFVLLLLGKMISRTGLYVELEDQDWKSKYQVVLKQELLCGQKRQMHTREYHNRVKFR